MTHQVNWLGLLISYIGLPIFITIGVSYKIFNKTKMVDLRHASFKDEPSLKEDEEEILPAPSSGMGHE